MLVIITCGCLPDVEVPNTDVRPISSPSGSIGKQPVEQPIAKRDEASPATEKPAAAEQKAIEKAIDKEAADVGKAIENELTPPVVTANPPASINLGRLEALIVAITIFVIACFVGYEVINKVPTTLHTPLMSGSNAISGITVVGAIIIGGYSLGAFSSFVGFLAIVLAMINVVGGFLVTHRMLAMFKRK